MGELFFVWGFYLLVLEDLEGDVAEVVLGVSALEGGLHLDVGDFGEDGNLNARENLAAVGSRKIWKWSKLLNYLENFGRRLTTGYRSNAASRSPVVFHQLNPTNLGTETSKKNWGDFVKILWKSVTLNNLKNIFFKSQFSKIFLKIPPIFVLNFVWIYELARQFSMCTDFVINFDFKNDWVIAVWKFQLWISF